MAIRRDGTLLVVSEASRGHKGLFVALLAVLILAGCGKGGEQGGEESEARTLPTDGPIKGGAVAKVELDPSGDFDTSGIAAFKEVGGSGVQVDLEVEGLPKPGSTYYAHFHEGRCADVSTDDGYGPEEAHAHGRVGVVLALVRPERLLGWGAWPRLCPRRSRSRALGSRRRLAR